MGAWAGIASRAVVGGHLASAVSLCVMLLLRGVDGSLEGGSEREARALSCECDEGFEACECVLRDSLLLFGVCSVGQEAFDRLSVREDCISEVAHGVVKGGLPRELRVVRVHEGEIPVEGIEGVSDECAGFRADDLVFDYIKNYESVKLIDVTCMTYVSFGLVSF